MFFSLEDPDTNQDYLSTPWSCPHCQSNFYLTGLGRLRHQVQCQNQLEQGTLINSIDNSFNLKTCIFIYFQLLPKGMNVCQSLKPAISVQNAKQLWRWLVLICCGIKGNIRRSPCKCRKKWCRRKYSSWEMRFLAYQRSTFVSRRFHDFLLPPHDCTTVELKYEAFVLH